MGLIINPQRESNLREVKDAAEFVRAVEEMEEPGLLEVWIQFKGGTYPDSWTDYERFWSGAYDRHRAPPLPMRGDMVAAGIAAGARHARTVVRTVV